MATQADPRELDLQEQIVRIRKSIIESDRIQAEIRKLIVDADKTSLDAKIAPWQVGIAGMTAGGALVAATAAITKIFS